MTKKAIILLLFILVGFISQGQTGMLDNAKITALTKAKLGDELIIGLIHSSPSNFDCSVAGIIQLKKDSVSENVIAEVVNVCKTGNQTTAMVAATTENKTSEKDTAYKSFIKYGLVDAAKVEQAMGAIRAEKDEFSKSTSYFSQKTPKSRDDQDRLYGYVYQNDSGYVYLKLVISHVNVFQSGYRNLSISQIALKADTSTYLITNRHFIYGNGRRHIYYDAALHYDGAECAFLKKIIASNETKVRFEEAGGNYLDFKVSDREKKALSEVLELYKAMRGIMDP
jgi:hypothetical protein